VLKAAAALEGAEAMKLTAWDFKLRIPLVAVLTAFGLQAATAAEPTWFGELANSPFPEGQPTSEAAQTLEDELLFQRATQTYMWAMPAIMTLGMQAGSEKAFGAGYNILPIWKSLTDARTLVFTPNTVTMYAVSYLDLGKDGPLVMELPPRLQGFLSDYWGVPIPVEGTNFAGDVGFAGPDHGKGGKFLLVPPGNKSQVPNGYYVYRSATMNVLVTLRAFVANPKELGPAVEHLEMTKVYPLNDEAGAKPMKFPDASAVKLNLLPSTSSSAFDQIKQLLDSEGDNLASPDWLGMLASIGIIKGQPFKPDAHTRSILDKAAMTGFKTARVLSYDAVMNGVSQVMYPDRHWINPFTQGTRADPSGPWNLSWIMRSGGYRALDARTGFFSYSWGVSPGMFTFTPGEGAIYAIDAVDSQGKPLSGSNLYRLHLPANIPAKLFWNVTLYDAFTAALYDNGQEAPALGSPQKPEQNADESTDLYFGPKAPDGKTSNWLPTAPGRAYMAILRLYFPTEAAIDKSWKPGDFEEVR
jgi:hypothetical protein